MSNNYYPRHLARSRREWKSRKRRELASGIRALGDYRFGCAWTPEYKRFVAAVEELQSIRKSLSVKNWGR